MRRALRYSGILALIVASAWTAPAQADAASSAPKTSEQWVTEGISLRKLHSNEAALLAFQRALALEATPRTKAHVALAYQALGRWIEAETGLRDALTATGDSWIVRHRQDLEDALSVVGAHLAWIDIECNAPLAELLIDGEALTLPQRDPHRVVSGHHDLVIRAPGYRDELRSIDTPAGEHFHERVELSTRLTPSPSPSGRGVETPAEESSIESSAGRLPPAGNATLLPKGEGPGMRRIAGLSLGGLGVGAVALGAVYGALAIATRQQRDTHCNADHACDPSGMNLDKTGRSQALVSTVAFAVGGVALGGGVTLFFTATERNVRSSTVGIAVGGRF